MHIGFGLLLNPASHNYIRALQLELHQEFGIHFGRQFPHVTIKSPFETDDPAPYLHYLGELATHTPPVALTFDGFGHFNQRILYLAVAPNSFLRHLHDRILVEMKARFGLTPHEFEGPNIQFHATIAGFDDPPAFLAVQEYLTNRTLYFEESIRELGLFHFLGPESGWIVQARYAFQGLP